MPPLLGRTNERTSGFVASSSRLFAFVVGCGMSSIRGGAYVPLTLRGPTSAFGLLEISHPPDHVVMGSIVTINRP
eukprot:scaffold2992_cov214-Amphora_coffeaeformis.AAC.1